MFFNPTGGFRALVPTGDEVAPLFKTYVEFIETMIKDFDFGEFDDLFRKDLVRLQQYQPIGTTTPDPKEEKREK